MNVPGSLGWILMRSVQELYNETGLNGSLLTPAFVTHALNDIILGHYWSVFQDKDFSYYKNSENVLNINNLSQIYPLPNGDPAQVDQITFSAPITGGNWSFKFAQGANNSTIAGLGANTTPAALQTGINANGFGLKATVTALPGGGFNVLWDQSSLLTGPITVSTPVNTTGVQIFDTVIPAGLSNLNVAFVTLLRQRTGTPGNYSYSPPITAINPNDKYNNASPGPFNFQAPWLTNNNSSQLAWCFDSGLPDGNGFPTFNIRVINYPLQTATLIYDCLRYPKVLSDTLVGGNIDLTQIPDIPMHFGPVLVMRVLEQAFLRAGLDTREITLKIQDLDEKAYAVETQGVQRQNSYGIRRVR